MRLPVSGLLAGTLVVALAGCGGDNPPAEVVVEETGAEVES
jgi:hypothetical protein